MFGNSRRTVANVSGRVAGDLHELHVQCIAPGSQVFHGRSYALIIGSRGRWHAIKIQAQSSSSSYHSGYVRIVTLTPRSIAHLEPHAIPNTARARPVSLPRANLGELPRFALAIGRAQPVFHVRKGLFVRKGAGFAPFFNTKPISNTGVVLHGLECIMSHNSHKPDRRIRPRLGPGGDLGHNDHAEREGITRNRY
ncbi:MAG TPA: hypothetical protein VFB06_19450 [Streptosporangiaceae bacterium]|nr:hypothetical protein [Streptosporangiaceae bacterium]